MCDRPTTPTSEVASFIGEITKSAVVGDALEGDHFLLAGILKEMLKDGLEHIGLPANLYYFSNCARPGVIEIPANDA